MAIPKVSSGGGWPAVRYVLKKGIEAGGLWKTYKRLRSRNVCKTCALGMGGQRGGMVNEAGHFPEICKKSVQAQVGDMAGVITEEDFRRSPVALMEQLSSAQMEKLGRLVFPVIAREGDTHFKRIKWEEAFDRIADSLKSAPPEEVFFYSSGRSSNEAAFLFQLVARAYGTANIHNCSYYCHAASGVALSKVYGSGTASVVLEDLSQADLALIIGANPASNHPRLITQLINLRRRGGKVITINPLKELGLVRFKVPSDWRSFLFGSTISDVYLQPKVGTDIALLKALLKSVVEAGGVDKDYVEKYTTGWEEVERDLSETSWESLTSFCGVERKEIEKAVKIVLESKKGIFCWAMGLTHHVHGVDNILALSNLALARGWLGKPGVGLLPIRGHSNVQGVGSVGVAPKVKEAFADKLEKLYGITVPKDPGQDTYASMEAASQGKIRSAILLGGNLYSSNPDLDWASKALRSIPFTAYISTKLNPGHVHGRGKTTLILPPLARDEEAQWTTQESMFNFVRLSEGGTPSVEGDLKSEVEIISEIASRILPQGKFDWSRFRDHKTLREEIGKVVPGYGAMKEIDATRNEFQIEGRTFHEPRFKTPDGKAHFYPTSLPDFSVGEDEFRLMTLRSEGQFNTVVYEEEDLYRGNSHRNVVMLSQADADRLEIGEGEPAIVESETGSLRVSAAIVDISEGSLAMYYPEANALVPRKLDSRSKTPAFKSIVVRLRKAPTATGRVSALKETAEAI
jgi:molybdopterin-dependent oxidoreductase alpha subunit